MHQKEAVCISVKSYFITKFLSMIVFVVLLSISALIRIPLPFTPVPVTMQTFVVFLSGVLLGPVVGMVAILSYMTLGFIGVPLFTNAGSGWLYFFGPTGGYLTGFILASGLSGFLYRRLKSRNIFSLSVVMMAGIPVIYFCGGLWLSLGYHWSLKEILALGVLPFIGPDIVKVFCAAALAQNFFARKK
jgi:biotin transport system substrate-specific component